MKVSIEMKIAFWVIYTWINLVGINYAFYCMNQASNVWLSMGVIIAMFLILFNSFIIRRKFTKILEGITNEADTAKGE